MEKKIRTELLKMSGIMLVLVGLGIYAHDFVITGIQAKVALNSSIFALFGVAAFLGFRHVTSLSNEVVALKALQIDYGAKSRRPKDPYASPAVVFKEPVLLGAGYRLITEELGKQDDLEISNSTVQALIHDVDARINDRKSTLLYFSGLMVFLGLLGAFMGLMKTVHSVSDLIGSMDMSGKGGTDAFGKMIEGMKAPLNGMSVGFSSSLFGLMTSMVLGALERCMTAAMKALRDEFEHWLSNMAALESNSGEAMGRNDGDRTALRKVVEAGTLQLREMRELLVASASHAEQNREQMAAFTASMQGLAEAVRQVSDPAPLLRPVTEAVASLARNQIDMLSHFRGLYEEAASDREHISGMLRVLEATVERTERLDAGELHRQLDRMLALQGELLAAGQRHEAPERLVIQRRGGGPLAGLLGWLGLNWLGLNGLGAGATSPDVRLAAARHEARLLRREVRVMLAANRRALRQMSGLVGRRLDRIEQGRQSDSAALGRVARLSLAHRADLADLAGRFDRLEDGGQAADGLHGLFDRLRHRLGADFDEAAEEARDGDTRRRRGQAG